MAPAIWPYAESVTGVPLPVPLVTRSGSCA